MPTRKSIARLVSARITVNSFGVPAKGQQGFATLFALDFTLQKAFDCFAEHNGDSLLSTARCQRKQGTVVFRLHLYRRPHLSILSSPACGPGTS
jgi:hypothetical protein